MPTLTLSVQDPVPPPTSSTSPASSTAPVEPLLLSPHAKKSEQVCGRFAPQPVDTELERLRKVNRARRTKLNDDMNSGIKEPLVVSAPLASSDEILAYSAVLLQITAPHSAYFADWSTHVDDSDAYYFSFQDNAYIQIISEPLPHAPPSLQSTFSLKATAQLPRMSPRHFLKPYATPHGVNLPDWNLTPFLPPRNLLSTWILQSPAIIFNRERKCFI
jgi:hypothetical protein